MSSLSDIANEIKTHIESGEQWFAKVLADHVPALVAEAERIAASPVVKALEDALLPPEFEAEVVKIIGAFAAVVQGAAAPAVAADAGQPAPDAESEHAAS